MSRWLILALSACFVWPLSLRAAEKDPGIWVTFTTTDAFNSAGERSRWLYWFDAQARYFDIGSGINQWLVRPGIGYEMSADKKVWLGYARFRSRNRAGDVTDENRYWQQLDWNAGRWRAGSVAFRVRLEQRSLSNGDDLGLVLRLGGRYIRPIGNQRKTSLILGLEPFLALRDTDWGGDAGFTQNRLYVLLGWRLTNDLALAAGYMNQYIKVDSGEDRNNHLGVLNFRLML